VSNRRGIALVPLRMRMGSGSGNLPRDESAYMLFLKAGLYRSFTAAYSEENQSKNCQCGGALAFARTKMNHNGSKIE
jgi:hypothetical protein